MLSYANLARVDLRGSYFGHPVSSNPLAGLRANVAQAVIIYLNTSFRAAESGNPLTSSAVPKIIVISVPW